MKSQMTILNYQTKLRLQWNKNYQLLFRKGGKNKNRSMTLDHLMLSGRETAVDRNLRIWCHYTNSYFKTLGGNMISPCFKCRFSTCGNFIRFKLQSGHVLIYPTTKNTELNLKDLGRVKFYQNKRL